MFQTERYVETRKARFNWYCTYMKDWQKLSSTSLTDLRRKLEKDNFAISQFRKVENIF